MAADVGVVLQLCLVPGDVGAGHVDEFGGEIRVYGWESEGVEVEDVFLVLFDDDPV